MNSQTRMRSLTIRRYRCAHNRPLWTSCVSHTIHTSRRVIRRHLPTSQADVDMTLPIAVGIWVHAHTVRLVHMMNLMLERVMTGWMLVLIWPVVRLSIWLLLLVVLVLEVMWWMLRIVLLELLMGQIGLVVVVTEPTAHPSYIRGHVPRRLIRPWRAEARHARNAGVLHVYRRSVHPVHMLLMLGLMKGRVRVLAIRHPPRRTGVEVWWRGLIWVLNVVVRIVDR